MPKFQIIVQIDAAAGIWFDDEATQILKPAIESLGWSKEPDTTVYNLKVLYIMNLDGIRKELWVKKEELKEETRWQEEATDRSETIEESFKGLASLFKIQED